MSTNNTPRLNGGMGMGMGTGMGIGLGLGSQASQAQSQGQTRMLLSSPLNLQNNMLPKPTVGGGGGGLFLSSDDHLLTKQIEEKHAPDGTQIDVRPLLHLVQDILTNATQTNTAADAIDDHAKATTTTTATQVVQQKPSLDSKILLSGLENMPDLPIILERISCEMACKCLGGTDAHGVTLSVLNTLSRFTWEAKLVLTLAAFSLSYGEFWLLAKIYSTNPLAKSMALLKQLPTIMEHSADSLKRQFEAINNLIKAMLDVTKMVVDFNELPSEYISQDEPVVEAAINQFPVAVYWTIRSSVSAATQITVLTSVGHEYMPSANEMELSNWTNKLTVICGHLGKIKAAIIKLIDSKKDIEAYNKIKKTVYSMIHSDNMTVLKMLIYGKDDILPLYDGSNNKRVQIDILRGKMVLLLVSSLDIPSEQLSVLIDIHKDSSKTHAYEIIWAPVVDRTVSWDDTLQAKFERLQAVMPWYSVQHPSMIGGAVINFFREDWAFKGEPILVGLDTQGKVISPNAMPMMLIWGSRAFPFTVAREESLWKEETWKLDLLLGNSIDQTIQTWMKEDKYIFLFGGDDIEWIRRFIKEALSVAQSSNINSSSFEFLYVGKSCKKVETIRKIISTIENEKLCTVWKDTSKIWFFWTRLQSMLHSKIQLDKVNDVADIVTPEIKKLISYDKNASGMWALLAKGPKVVLSGPGSTIFTALQEFDKWKADIHVVGFEAAFLTFHQKIYLTENPCCRFEFPTGTGKIPECMKCPDCHSTMQNYTTFLCCHEGSAAATISFTANSSVEFQASGFLRGASAN